MTLTVYPVAVLADESTELSRLDTPSHSLQSRKPNSEPFIYTQFRADDFDF